MLAKNVPRGAKKRVRKFVLVIFVKRPIKPPGKIFKTQKKRIKKSFVFASERDDKTLMD